MNPVSQVFEKHGDQVRGANPTTGELHAIAVLRKIGLAAEDLRSLLYSIVETEILEGVERIVMDEYGYRPLGRQHMGCVIDSVLKSFQAFLFGRRCFRTVWVTGHG